MFQTPTSMRAHRITYHGYVPELTPGHPHSKKENLFTPVPAKKKGSKKRDSKKPVSKKPVSMKQDKPKHFNHKDPAKIPKKN